MKMQSKNFTLKINQKIRENGLYFLLISLLTSYEFSKIGIWSNNIYINISRLNFTLSNFPGAGVYMFYTISLFFLFKYLKENIKEISGSYLNLFIIIFLKKLLVSSTIFFILQITFISRLELIVFSVVYSILFVVIFFIANIRKEAFIILLILLNAFTILQSSEYYSNYKIDNCINSFSSKNLESSEEVDSIVVIGHAYGSQKTNINGLSTKVQNLFTNRKDGGILVLTGDIVLNNSLSSLKVVKKQIESSFKKYLIAVGNHDVGYSKKNEDRLQTNNNFIDIFNQDLYIQELENFSLIAANFSTPNWEPSKISKNEINNYLEKTENEIIFLFSHQIFWAREVTKSIQPNGMNMLENNLRKDSLHWLNYENKKIIVISGDYGVTGSKTFCERVDNKLFIANGIGDLPQDTYIKISYNKKSFRINIIDLPN